MPILQPKTKMTPKELEARIRMHESLAEKFEENREPAIARKFRDLAETYRAELSTRTQKQDS